MPGMRASTVWRRRRDEHGGCRSIAHVGPVVGGGLFRRIKGVARGAKGRW
jgi:hypothetical protein